MTDVVTTPDDPVTVAPPSETLPPAEDQYQAGLQAIRDNELEKAVELFANVLQTRIEHYGETAEECGTAYYRYGAALFYRAQEEQDVFGDDMKTAAQQRDVQVAAARAAAEAEAEAEDEATAAAEGADPAGGDGAAVEGPGEDAAEEAAGLEADADKTNAAGAADVIAPAAASAVAEPGTGEAGDAAASPIAAQRDEHDGAKENVPGNGAAMADVPANKPGAIASAEAPADAKPAEPKEGLIEDGDDSNDEEELEEEEEEEEEEEAAANAEAGPSTAQTGSDEQDEDTSDLKLAWENLEVAKVIFSCDPSKYPFELADVHMLLADLACEDENFESALPDYERAMDLLTAPKEGKQPDVRRVAEVHFKVGLALQFLQQPAKALTHTQLAVKLVRARMAELDTALAEAKAAGADVAVAAAEKEISGLEDSLDGLQERVEELKQVMQEDKSTKEVLKAAFSQLASIPEAGGARPSTDGAGPSNDGASTSSGNPFANGIGGPVAAPSAAAPVMNLGIVGRGKGRITLQPAGGAGSAAGASGTTGAFGAAAAAAGSAAEVPKKRSLEDVIGGEASAGFGTATPGSELDDGAAAPASAQPEADAPVKSPAKKLKVEPAQGALPAFLSPAGVSAAYPSGEEPAGSASIAGRRSDALPAFLSPAAVTAAYANGSAAAASSANAAENA